MTYKTEEETEMIHVLKREFIAHCTLKGDSRLKECEGYLAQRVGGR